MDKSHETHVNNAAKPTSQADKPGPAPAPAAGAAPPTDKPQAPAVAANGPITTSAPGSGDAKSKQQQQSMPGADELKGKWKQHVGAAKVTWGKLTDNELLTTEGHAQKLAGLVQERYAITRDEADKQVKSFLAKHDS